MWSIKKRPKSKTFFTLFDLIIEIAGLVAFLFMWILLFATYSGLPDLITTPFNISGQEDVFREKSTVFNLPLCATFLFVVTTILSRFPRISSYPVVITESNAFLQYSYGARLIRCLKLTIVLFFVYIVIHTVFFTGEYIGKYFLLLSLAIVLIQVIYFLVKSFKYR